MKTAPQILFLPLFLTGFLLFAQLNTFAQEEQYGDLEVTVLGNGSEPAKNVPVKAIDPDEQDTVFKLTNENGKAFFDNLYIYTSIGINENPTNETPSLTGLVKFFDLQGQYKNEKMAMDNGTILWDGAGQNIPAGIYIAKDEAGNIIKFFYYQNTILLGKPIDYSSTFKSREDTINIYELWADGRNIEWNPFDEYMEELELVANTTNHFQFDVPIVPDGPAIAEVQIFVDGKPAGDNSELKIVRTGETDTTYAYTLNGSVSFDATSHPFGNFTRDYTIIINAFNADSNWFQQETHDVQIALGNDNFFLFNPDPVPIEELTANITLDIIILDGTPATSNAEVKVYKEGSTDTTSAFTNSLGIATFTQLVNPFHPDNYTFAINSNLCADTFFVPLVKPQTLYPGQNNIEMNPFPVYFADGRVTAWNGLSTASGVEINIWKLNSTIDTLVYTTNTAGWIYYEDVPLDGSSTDYVFKSTWISETDLYTALDTFSIEPGFNDMINIYLDLVPEYNHAIGTVREFYDQDSLVENVEMEIWERNADTLFASCTTNTAGYWHIDSIPLGFEAEIKMIGLTNYFNRIHNFDFPDDVLEPGGDSTSVLNMLHIPLDMIIPQTVSDPTPPTLVADAAEVAELVGYDKKNGEQIARFENRINLVNFATPSDSLIYFGAEEAIDSLFYKGNGSPLVLVANTITITAYHAQNYDINIGFPGELGWNLTYGGGNITTPSYSNLSTGHYILGGEIHVMSGLSERIKELEHRRKQLGDVTSRSSFGNPTNPTMPNIKDRAYVNAIDINLDARINTGNEVFPLDGLTTTITQVNAFKAGEMKQPYLIGPPKPPKQDKQIANTSSSFIEDVEFVYDYQSR